MPPSLLTDGVGRTNRSRGDSLLLRRACRHCGIARQPESACRLIATVFLFPWNLMPMKVVSVFVVIAGMRLSREITSNEGEYPCRMPGMKISPIDRPFSTGLDQLSLISDSSESHKSRATEPHAAQSVVRRRRSGNASPAQVHLTI
jgi:hypothetical protein